MQTKVTIKLRQSEKRDRWYLFLDTYPIFENGKKRRERVNIGRSVSSVVWNKDAYSGIKTPKIDRDGVIVCLNQIDYDACRFAEQLRRKNKQNLIDTP